MSKYFDYALKALVSITQTHSGIRRKYVCLCADQRQLRLGLLTTN